MGWEVGVDTLGRILVTRGLSDTEQAGCGSDVAPPPSTCHLFPSERRVQEEREATSQKHVWGLLSQETKTFVVTSAQWGNGGQLRTCSEDARNQTGVFKIL